MTGTNLKAKRNDSATISTTQTHEVVDAIGFYNFEAVNDGAESGQAKVAGNGLLTGDYLRMYYKTEGRVAGRGFGVMLFKFTRGGRIGNGFLLGRRVDEDGMTFAKVRLTRR